MTAVAFERAVGSRWIVSVILAAALLSLSKCSTAIWSPPAACCLPWDAGVWWSQRGQVHRPNQTPSVAVLCIGVATAAMHVPGRRDSGADYRCWLAGVRSGMAGGLRRVLSDGAQPAGNDGGRHGSAGRAADDSDESRSGRARTFQRLRMAGPGNLDRAGRSFSAVEPQRSAGVPSTSLRTGSAGCRWASRPPNEVARDSTVEVENKNGDTMGSSPAKDQVRSSASLLLIGHSPVLGANCAATASFDTRHHQRPHHRRHRLAVVLRRHRHPRRKDRRHRQSERARRARAPSMPTAWWSRPDSSTCWGNRS